MAKTADRAKQARRALLEAIPWFFLDSARALLLAHSALETGRWTKIPGNNFGGIKAGGSWKGERIATQTREVVNGQNVILIQSFRAYPTLDEGAEDFVSFLRDKYPEAWVWLQYGNAEKYVRALKKAKYFTADEDDYLKAVSSLQKEFMSANLWSTNV